MYCEPKATEGKAGAHFLPSVACGSHLALSSAYQVRHDVGNSGIAG
jgi:hypothetical protein